MDEHRPLVSDSVKLVAELLEVAPPASEREELPRTPALPGRQSPAPYSLQKLAKEHTEAALDTILEIMNDTEQEGSTRLEAAKQLLDRGWGKAAMKIDAKTTHVSVHEVLKELGSRVKEPPRLAEIVDVTAEDVTDA